MSSSLPFIFVDAFTNSPFKGNPAAILVYPRGSPIPPDPTLKSIARELNLPTSVFITQLDDAENATAPTFGIRRITPIGMDLPLCGHGTLAAVRVLFSDSTLVPPQHDVVHLNYASGTVSARRVGEKIELVFPSGDIAPITDVDLKAKIEQVARRAFGGNENVNVRFAGSGQGVSFNHLLVVEIDGDKFELEGAAVDPSIFVSNPSIAINVTVC